MKSLWNKACKLWADMFSLVPKDRLGMIVFYALVALMAGAFLYCWGYDFIIHL